MGKLKYIFYTKFQPIFGVYKTRVKLMSIIMFLYALALIFLMFYKNVWSFSISFLTTLLFAVISLLLSVYDAIDEEIKIKKF